jgi:uncharacterized protein (DUF2141 family)
MVRALFLAGALTALTSPHASAAPTPIVPGGNVTPVLDAVNGKVAVAASGAPVDDRVAVIVENGTSKPARIERVTATATRGGGATVTRSQTVTTFPRVLAPGNYALAVLQFRKGDAPADATMQYRVTSSAAGSSTDPRSLAMSDFVLSAPLTGPVAQTLRATVTNPSTKRTARAPRVAVMCFNEARKPVTFTMARTEVKKLAPAKTATVSVSLATLCPTYLVAASST